LDTQQRKTSMPEADNGQNPHTPIQTPGKGRGWTRLVSYVKRKMHERSTKKKKESAIDRAARRTANATVWLAIFTVVLAVVSGLTLFILKRQLGEMRGSGKQTDKLICLYQKQVAQLAKQAGDTHTLAVAAGKQAAEAIIQANAARISAEAAKSASQTAKDSLHVSERAYVVIEEPSFGFSTKSVSLPLVNSGHIPSGEMISVIHEATFNVATPTDRINYTIPNQIDWQHQRWDSILPGNHQSLIIPIPLLEEDRVNVGTQMVVVAGSLTYNDGFIGSPQQKWKFCFRNWYQTVMKKPYLSPCNPDEILPYLEKADGYPNNEHRD
jgi:hypothetical protein